MANHKRTEAAYTKAVKAAGGVSAVARALGLSGPSVSNWRKRGIPADRVLSLEALSGVPRHALRPDIYPAETVHRSMDMPLRAAITSGN